MQDHDFFSRDALSVAANLVGAELRVDGVGGIIVETEAYAPEDAASHSYRGETVRNRGMFGPPAHAYVYRSYGIHWCLNFVCLPGSAVLIRALAPTVGIGPMVERRGTSELRLLCSGPGRLCQALNVTDALDEHALSQSPFHLALPSTRQRVANGPRIGITRAAHLPWRFGLEGSPFLSRKI